jgi:hypothetical protein
LPPQQAHYRTTASLPEQIPAGLDNQQAGKGRALNALPANPVFQRVL